MSKIKYIISGLVIAASFGYLYSSYGMDIMLIAAMTIIVTNQLNQYYTDE